MKLPRNKLEATAEDISQLQRSTQIVTFTIDAIQAHLCDPRRVSLGGATDCPILALFEVISTDTSPFACALKATLDGIGRDSLDEYLVQRRLAHWRRLMNEFQTEIPAVISSLQNFVDFVSKCLQNEALSVIEPGRL